MYLHKNGIELKILESEDLKIMKDLKDESWYGTHKITIKNYPQQEKWFNSIDNEKIIFLIGLNEKKEKIGIYKISNVDYISRICDCGYDVFIDYRNKGYGKLLLEAGIDFSFEILNMNRINTEVIENNAPSHKIIKYVGFVEEGIKRKSVFKCGNYLDSICFGLLQEEWKKLERVKKYNSICNVSYKLIIANKNNGDIND